MTTDPEHPALHDRTGPAEVVALIIFLIGLIGVVAALTFPNVNYFTFTDTASIPPVKVTLTTKCGSPLRGGPRSAPGGADHGEFLPYPCRGNLAKRRAILGGAGAVMAVGAALIAVAERQRRSGDTETDIAGPSDSPAS